MSQLPRPLVSASINVGKKSNRVARVRRVVQHIATDTDGDAAARGLPYTMVTISIPVAWLERIDATARARRMSRSAFLRHCALESSR